jgi:hypothetical protein
MNAVSSNGQPGGEYTVDRAHFFSDANTALRALSVTESPFTVFVFVGVGEAESVLIGVGVGEEVSTSVVIGVGVASLAELDEVKFLSKLKPLII